jgi:hypothetical protein
MREHRKSRLALALVAVGFCIGAASLPSGAAAKKNGKKGSSTANVTVNVNGIINTAPSNNQSGILASTATLGKKFKGRIISDVNITLQGGASGAGSSINTLRGRLTAPNGDTVDLFSDFLFGQVLGPLTLDDETPVRLTGGGTPSPDPDVLNAPYAGTAEPFGGQLSAMDFGPARGTWTLKIRNQDTDPLHVHTLAQWSLRVKTRPPLPAG